MSGENKFFFEDDDEPLEKNIFDVSSENEFEDLTTESGLQKALGNTDLIKISLLENDIKKINSQVVSIEYGITGNDYVMHVTPTHPKRNLSEKNRLHEALRSTILELNKFVPYDLRVDIHTPQEDWEIKATSFIIRGGAAAWNLDRVELDTIAVPSILEAVTAICLKP